MKDVNMYIYTEYTGSVQSGTGKYHVILEYMAKTRNGEEPATLKELAVCEDITKNRLELLAVITGLKRLTVPCRITIHTASDYVTAAILNKWLDKWVQNDFTSRNKPIRHADLWRELSNQMREHEILIQKEERTPYTAAQQIELKNCKEWMEK